MKKSLSVLLLSFIGVLGFSQGRVGLSYTPKEGHVKINYLKKYVEKVDTFETIYTIRNANTHKHLFDVVATHYKKQKKIVVTINEVNAVNAGILGHSHKEEKSYEIPSLEPFGIGGTYKALTGGDTPNQLALKFVSGSYENVKVIETLVIPNGDNPLFFILEKF